MLEKIEAAPKDAILGLTESFKADPRGEKINLSVGVYQDETGKTPLLECVKEAERRLAWPPVSAAQPAGLPAAWSAQELSASASAAVPEVSASEPAPPGRRTYPQRTG